MHTFLSSSHFRRHGIKSVRMQHLASLSLKNSQQFKPQNIVTNTARKHQLASLFSNVSPQFQLPKHRVKLRQNTPVCVLDFIFLSADPTFLKKNIPGENTKPPTIFLFRVNFILPPPPTPLVTHFARM